jgi:hypothetical protein
MCRSPSFIALAAQIHNIKTDAVGYRSSKHKLIKIKTAVVSSFVKDQGIINLNQVPR